MKKLCMILAVISMASMTDTSVRLPESGILLFDRFGDRTYFIFVNGTISIQCEVNQCVGHKIIELIAEAGDVVATSPCKSAVNLTVTITEKLKFGAYSCKYGAQISSNKFNYEHRVCSSKDQIGADNAGCKKEEPDVCMISNKYGSGSCKAVFTCKTYENRRELAHDMICPSAKPLFCATIEYRGSLQQHLSRYFETTACDVPDKTVRMLYHGTTLHLYQEFVVVANTTLVVMTDAELLKPLNNVVLDCHFKRSDRSLISAGSSNLKDGVKHTVSIPKILAEVEFERAKIYCSLTKNKKRLADTWATAVFINPKINGSSCQARQPDSSVSYNIVSAVLSPDNASMACTVRLQYKAEIPYMILQHLYVINVPIDADKNGKMLEDGLTVAARNWLIFAGVLGVAFAIVASVVIWKLKKTRPQRAPRQPAEARESVSTIRSSTQYDSPWTSFSLSPATTPGSVRRRETMT